MSISLNPINKTLITVGGAAAITLTPSQSGTTYICQKNAAANRIVNLPDPTIPGLSFVFKMESTAVVAFAIAFVSPTLITMTGNWRQINGTSIFTLDDPATGRVSFTATARSGDIITLISDGRYWICQGSTSTTAGIAFAV